MLARYRGRAKWGPTALSHAVRGVVIVGAIACLGLILHTVAVTWAQPCRHGSPTLPVNTDRCPTLLEDIAPLVVAIGLWGFGAAALVLSRGVTPLPFLLAAGVLAAGKLAHTGSDLSGRLFYLLLAWAPVGVWGLHAGLLPSPRTRPHLVVRNVLHVAALLLGLPAVLLSRNGLALQPWFGTWHAVTRAMLLVSVMASLGLVTWSWRSGSLEARRRPIRLAAFGTVSALLPLTLLSLLPDVLDGPFYLPYHVTFLGLLALPAGYVCSLAPGAASVVAGPIKRLAVIYWVYTLELGAFLLTSTVWGHLWPRGTSHWPAASLVFVALMVLGMDAVRRWVQRLIDWVWHGHATSYGDVVGRLSESLSTTLDRATLERLLVRELPRLLDVTTAALYLAAKPGDLCLVRRIGFAAPHAAIPLVPAGLLARHLLTLKGPATHDEVAASLAPAALSVEERELLGTQGLAIWMPLTAGGHLHGLLLIGPKAGEDAFTPEDMRILTIVAHQSGIAAHNVRLMGEVREGQQELERAHQRLLEASEQEQRRLAQELHDGAVQQLLGIRYQLAESRRGFERGDDAGPDALASVCATLDAMREEISVVVSQLRVHIGELRPAGLEDLGLASALAGYVARLQRERSASLPQIDLELGDDSQPMPYAVELCLFRAAQEGLRNALRHAHASRVLLRLRVEEGAVRLLLRDDGVGFRVPGRLSELATENHFGLVSMSERIALVAGSLEIESQPGGGTELCVTVPLDRNTGQEGGADDDPRATGRRSSADAGRHPVDALERG